MKSAARGGGNLAEASQNRAAAIAALDTARRIAASPW